MAWTFTRYCAFCRCPYAKGDTVLEGPGTPVSLITVTGGAGIHIDPMLQVLEAEVLLENALANSTTNSGGTVYGSGLHHVAAPLQYHSLDLQYTDKFPIQEATDNDGEQVQQYEEEALIEYDDLFNESGDSSLGTLQNEVSGASDDEDQPETPLLPGNQDVVDSNDSMQQVFQEFMDSVDETAIVSPPEEVTKDSVEHVIEPKWVQYTPWPLYGHGGPQCQPTPYPPPLTDTVTQIGAGPFQAAGIYPPGTVEKKSVKRSAGANWIPYQPGPKRRRRSPQDKPTPIAPQPLAAQKTHVQPTSPAPATVIAETFAIPRVDPRLAVYQASKRTPWGQGPPRQSRAKLRPAMTRLPPMPPAYRVPSPSHRPGSAVPLNTQVTSPGQVEQVNMRVSQKNIGNLGRVPTAHSGYGAGTVGGSAVQGVTVTINGVIPEKEK